MKRNKPQPKWWILYLLLPVYVLLAWIFTRLALTGTLLGIAQFGSMLLIFYLAYHWIEENEAAMLRVYKKKQALTSINAEQWSSAMNQARNPSFLLQAGKSLLVAVVVLTATFVMALIGRSLLGEGVIALLYLVPIGWATVRWGRIAGASAALSAALCFDFFFIPPYFTFIIGSLESWLLLLLFMVASIVVVGRMMSYFTQARTREQENSFLYELVALLPNLPTREEIAAFIMNGLQTYFEAGSVKVVLYQRDNQPSVFMIKSGNGPLPTRELPERTLPIYSRAELVGRITISQAAIPLPGDDDPLLKSICGLVAMAVDRAQTMPSSRVFEGPALEDSQAV